ncbi:MAG: DUF998 domain-containing protein [Acidimicrobiales bacterium]
MAGPLAFVAAWAVLGAGAQGYDPIRHAISRLAALGAPTRPAMTAALLVLGAGMALYGLALRPGTGWWLAAVNGLAAVAVAALPLGGGVDRFHGAAAAAGYVTLAAIPVVVGRGRPLAVAVGVLAALCLLTSVVVSRDGLFQRAGLTVAHVWVVVSALGLILGRSPTSSSRTPPARAPAARRR